MFQILILFSVLACTKSQTSLSKIKSADVTSCVDNATLGLKERFGADYSCFTTDFSTFVDGVNLSAQCQSIIAQCESISQSTQISQNTSVPLSNVPSNIGSDMFDNLGTPITANNPVAPEYDALNQYQLTNPNSVDQNSLNSFNNSITDPVFSFGAPIKDSNLNFLDPFTPGVSSPATANEPFSDLIGPLSTNYKYDSDTSSKIISILSRSNFTAGGYPCGAPPYSFTGFCFACVGNSLADIGRWTDGMDGPNRNEARSVAQVSDITALQSGYLNITAKYPKCGPMNSHPVNPSPPPGTIIVYAHYNSNGAEGPGHITVMKDGVVACADSCTPLEDTLAGSFRCLKMFLPIASK